MINYYINPKNRDLILVDHELDEILVLPPIEHIRVFTGGEIKLGDFGGEKKRDDIDSNKPIKRKKGYRLTDQERSEIRQAIKVGELKPGKIIEKFGISSALYYQLKRKIGK